ncbi:MAG TPA: hypothetical protein VHO00_12015 [Actinomycetes bacterium]|nr:hypothetical protein [Actinomycetes bacterium]
MLHLRLISHLATLLARVAGPVEPAMLDSEHPLTSFISRRQSVRQRGGEIAA